MPPGDLCQCGLTHAECAEAWDKKLGIVGHASDSSGGPSQYRQNIDRINRAKAEGLDPYHNRLNSRSGR